jgi:hypothetical protein
VRLIDFSEARLAIAGGLFLFTINGVYMKKRTTKNEPLAAGLSRNVALVFFSYFSLAHCERFCAMLCSFI